MDLALATVSELAPLIEKRQVSPVELLEAVRDRIEALDGDLATYVTILGDSAEAEARGAEEEIASGRHRGPLHGIPVAIKDSIAVAGAPTTNGSRLWADNVTDFDATVVRRLREAGAVVVGKNNMHEWGMGGTCRDMHYGTVRNPWDRTRVPGGSSGGSAAAVAAGLATAAIGADGWGSIRTPASYCGVVGLMPTHGLVSRFGELPPTSSWHHTIGPITRCVADAGLVLDVIRGYDSLDPTSIDASPTPGLDLDSGRPPRRVGVASAYFLDDATAPVRDALQMAQQRFEQLGAEIVEVDLSMFYDVPLVLAASQHESQSVLLSLALQHPDGFVTPEIRYRILAGEFVSAADQRRGMQLRNRMRARALEALHSVDVVLTPCNSTVAFGIDDEIVAVGTEAETVDLSAPGGQSRLTTRLTLPWNLIGVPALSMPSGAVADGMPVAIQLAAPPLAEETLLGAAIAYESTTEGYRPPPAVAAALTGEGGGR
jgi:aspartyl-tRNA(Asn)/glutamyl-tRNA(Gln) amidotransferase subunit A